MSNYQSLVMLLPSAARLWLYLSSGKAKVTGGIKKFVKRATAKDWCEYYGVEVKRGVAILFKAVRDDFKTSRGFLYMPGTVPTAPDWDGGAAECGGGLHYSPRPKMALEFDSGATRFVACPVRLSDIVVHPNGNYPQKVKAKGCCDKVWEVNEDGEKIEATK